MPLQQSEATADNPRNHCPYRRMHLELVVGVPCLSVALAARLETPIEAWPHLGAPVLGRQLVSNRSQPAKDESIDQVPNLGCQDRMGMGCPTPSHRIPWPPPQETSLRLRQPNTNACMRPTPA